MQMAERGGSLQDTFCKNEWALTVSTAPA
jgi:hypothetical protein